jgi:hypothetical protein
MSIEAEITQVALRMLEMMMACMAFGGDPKTATVFGTAQRLPNGRDSTLTDVITGA